MADKTKPMPDDQLTRHRLLCYLLVGTSYAPSAMLILPFSVKLRRIGLR